MLGTLTRLAKLDPARRSIEPGNAPPAGLLPLWQPEQRGVNTFVCTCVSVVAAATLATVTVRTPELPTLPVASVAIARSFALPFATVGVSHCTVNGSVVSSP